MKAQNTGGPLLLSVVIPCYNEAHVLRDTAEELHRYLTATDWDAGCGKRWEVVFVDDGSTDETLSVLKEVTNRYPNMRFVSYARTGGQGKALQAGFSAAAGQWIVTFDADLDYKPDCIKQFLAVAMQANADIVVGSPYRPGGGIENCPWARLMMSRLMNWYFRKLFRIGVTTFTAILRLYKKEALERLLLASYDKDFLPELLIKADLLKMSIIELPAVSVWDKAKTARRGKGQGVVATARKAARHLAIGLVERPFALLFYPMLLVFAAFILMTIGVGSLFLSHFAASGAGLLIDIRNSFSASYQESPHTFIFFVGAAQSLLIMFFAAVIILQNKTKSDNDFILMTKLHESIAQTMGGVHRDRQITPPDNEA